MIRILVVDHNAADETSRALYRVVSEDPDFRIRLLVPAVWYDNFRAIRTTQPLTEGSLSIVPLPVIFSTRAHRLAYRGLAAQVHEFHPDIILVNAEPENVQTFQGARLKHRGHCAHFVFTSWRNIDHTALGYPYRLQFLNRWVERFVLSVADHCIAFNETAASLMLKGGCKACTVIPPEVTADFVPDRRTETLRQRLGLKHFTVGYAGRFVPQKGLDVLLRAVSEVDGEVDVLLVGSGPEKGSLTELARQLGIENRVHWQDAVPRGAMPDLIRAMDVLVLPSRTESTWKEQFGRVLIEAMACGVPVIGALSGEIPRVIGSAGLTFREGDVKELARRMEDLRSSPPLHGALSKSGLARVAECYALPVVAAKYKNLFRALAAQR